MALSEPFVPSSIDSFSIPIKIRQPQHNNLKSIIFFIHGGIFTHGSKDCHPSIAEALAETNVVVTASFRNGSDAPWKSGVTMSDLKDVIGWIEKEREVRDEWRGLLLGLAGSSSVSFIPDHDLSFTLLLNLSVHYTNLCRCTKGRFLRLDSRSIPTTIDYRILYPHLSGCRSLQTSILPTILHHVLCS